MPRAATLSNGRMLVAFDTQGALRDLTFPHVGMENHAHGRSTRLAIVRGEEAVVVGCAGSSVAFHATDDAAEMHFSASLPRLALQVDVSGRIHPKNAILELRVEVRATGGSEHRVRVRLLGSFEISESNSLNGVEFLPPSRTLHFFRRRRHILLSGSVGQRAGLDEYQCGHHALPAGSTPADQMLNPSPQRGSTASVGDVEALGGLEIDLSTPDSAACFRIHAAESLGEALTLHADADAEGSTWGRPMRSTASKAERTDFALDPHARRSLTLCLAHCDHTGAIVAAVDSDVLFPGRESYAYCWPRDGAFIADTLGRMGHVDAATRFFQWVAGLERRSGALLQRYHPDGSVASGWMQSLQNGGPVLAVQQDETALVLLKLAQHVQRHGAEQIATPAVRAFVEEGTRFLLTHRGPSGLPRASVNLWEETHAIHAATVAVTVRALEEAHSLEALGAPSALVSSAREAGATMRRAFFDLWHESPTPPRHWFENPDGSPSRHHADHRMDVSLLWMQLEGLLTADDPRAVAIRYAVQERLAVHATFGGYARYEGDEYLRTAECAGHIAGNPWPLAAFMLARAFAEAGDLDAAQAALTRGFVSRSPAGHLPEQHHPWSGTPMGVMPLAWAHAAHLDAEQAIAHARSLRI